MRIKRLIPMVALLVIAVAAFALAGAQQAPGSGVRVPPGQLVDSPNAAASAQRPSSNRPPVPQAPSLPPVPSSHQLAFSADFASADQLSSSWQPLVTQGTFGVEPSSWTVKDGTLHQRGDAREFVTYDMAALIIKGVLLSDGIVHAAVYPTSGEPVGVVFRGSDAGFYRLSLFPSMPSMPSMPSQVQGAEGGQSRVSKAVIEKVTPTSRVVVAEAPVSEYAGYTLQEWSSITVSTQGTSIEVRVNGQTILQAQDAGQAGSDGKALTSGWAGVWSSADMGARFDNVRLLQLAAGR
jgi:hypothetical protein